MISTRSVTFFPSTIKSKGNAAIPVSLVDEFGNIFFFVVGRIHD